MTPGQFLRLVWPETGPYCIAHPFKPEGSATTLYRHHVTDTINEAVTYVHERANIEDVFFGVLSLKARQVWNADKIDHKTGQKGAYSVRTSDNIAMAKALFWDLDVGEESNKYPDQAQALGALATFIAAAKMPTPTLISSGRGVHVYWHMDRALPMLEWRTMAWHLRLLGEKLGVNMDTTRTIDPTSVLRVPDTFNWKDRANPRPVKAQQAGSVTPVADLQRILSDAMIAHGIVASEPPPIGAGASKPAVHNPLGEQQGFNDFGPPPTLEEVGDACAQVREIIRSQTNPQHPHYGPLDNTAWYRGMLATIKHVEDGDNWCRKLTALHPRTVSDIEAKLHQLEGFAPAKCTTLQQHMPWKDTPCQGCIFRDKVPNPLAATRKHTVAAPPMVAPASTSGAQGSVPPPPPPPTNLQGSASSPAPSGSTSSSTSAPTLMAPNPFLVQMIPNPPAPWERLKAGGIAITRKDKDGNETKQVIYQHDLYPLRRMSNKVEKREQQVWRVVLPRGEMREFTIDADALFDTRKFIVAIAHNGIYPNRADIPLLQDYMTAYISQLQKSLDAAAQCGHLGWAEENKQFVLPDKTLHADGSVTSSTLSKAAESASVYVRRAGDPNKQRELLRFYEDERYIPNQFTILASLGSILFGMTGHHGIVVNLSGDPGASKSSTLYTAASLWGDAVMWPINGTNRGATANVRMQRLVTNANLPTCVDEITHMPPKEAVDMVMGVTQPGQRLRMTSEGTERAVDDIVRSSIMITTANSSLHSLISQDSTAGTAGAMRVFEIKLAHARVHSKAEADEYLRELKANYGWIGEIFVQFVIQNYDRVAKRVHQVVEMIDMRARTQSGERFWSATMAVVYVAGEIAQALGLLTYDPDKILDWAISIQLPHMRGVVKDEYRDPLAILTDYIADKHGNIAVVDKSTSIGANTSGKAVAAETAYVVNKPHGALLGHYDLKTGTLALLKAGFKDACSKAGCSMSRILDELSTPRAGGRIIIEKSTRRTLGAGTDLAMGQTWCFVVDMTHPDIAGTIPGLAASGGTPTSPAAGNLQVVK